MSEGRVRVDVEHRESIFAILHTPLHEDYGEEVDTGGLEEWKGGGLGKVADIDD